MKLYLIRHAESANNVIYSSTGGHAGRVPDPDITARGKEQTSHLAEHLADDNAEKLNIPVSGPDGFHFTHLYCSLMTRTIMTATPIAKARGLTLTALDNTFENGGIFQINEAGEREGLPGPGRDYFKDRFPHLQLPDSVDNSGWYNRPYETNTMFMERMKQVVPQTIARHKGSSDSVALVAHGDFIDQFINELMGVKQQPLNYETDWESTWAFNNTSISRIDFNGKSPTVIYLNRLEHLPGDLITW